MSLLPQRGQDEEANEYLDRILPELNEILENSLDGTAFVKDGKVFVKVVSPHNASDKDLQIGNMLTNATKIVTIDTEKLEDAAVTLAKVANGSINADKLVTSEAVITQSAQIGDATILTAAIGDAQITNAKVNDLAANKITAGTLAADRIGANSITSGKIAADAITTDKIAANAITASEIATDAVTTAKLAANSITSAKLATSSLITQSAQINDGIITNAKINDLNASKINAGTLNVGRISAGSITTGKIIANAFTSFAYFKTTLATGVGQSFTWSPPISGQSYDCLIIANFITTGSTNSGASTTNKVETTGSGIDSWSRTVGLSGIIAAGNNTYMTNFGNNSGFFSTITGGNTYTTTCTTTTNLGAASVHCLVLMRNR
tara:strand:- start:2094 stop:3230 length:1137 start_codon:yes stop_codon:yes gene_type:complete